MGNAGFLIPRTFCELCASNKHFFFPLYPFIHRIWIIEQALGLSWKKLWRILREVPTIFDNVWNAFLKLDDYNGSKGTYRVVIKNKDTAG